MVQSVDDIHVGISIPGFRQQCLDDSTDPKNQWLVIWTYLD